MLSFFSGVNSLLINSPPATDADAADIIRMAAGQLIYLKRFGAYKL